LTVADATIVTSAAPAEETTAMPVDAIQVTEARRDEPAPPAFVRPVTSEPRFVVHEFAAATSPSRTYVSVTSPNTFSSSAYDASLQTVNTLSSGSARRTSAHPAAGNF
jgi:hypothetical protein